MKRSQTVLLLSQVICLSGIFPWPGEKAAADGNIPTNVLLFALPNDPQYGGILDQGGRGELGDRVPLTLAIGIRGEVYLGVWDQIYVYAANGTYLGWWGNRAGPRNEEARTPATWNTASEVYPLSGDGGGNRFEGSLGVISDMATDTSGNLYVADCENCRVMKFASTDGSLKYLGWWGRGFKKTDASFMPRRYDVKWLRTAFDTQKAVEGTSGWHPTGTGEYPFFGNGDGQFNNPEGVAADNDGNVYVADWLVPDTMERSFDYNDNLARYEYYRRKSYRNEFYRLPVRIQRFDAQGKPQGKLLFPPICSVQGTFLGPSPTLNKGTMSLFNNWGYKLEAANSGDWMPNAGRMATRPDGSICMLQYSRVRDRSAVAAVVVINKNLAPCFLYDWGKPGSGGNDLGGLRSPGEYSERGIRSNSFADLDIDASGNLWTVGSITESGRYEQGTLVSFSSNGTAIQYVHLDQPMFRNLSFSVGNGTSLNRRPIKIDRRGNLYLLAQTFDRGKQYIVRISGLATGHASLRNPTAVVGDRDGNLLVVDQGHKKIVRMGTNGNVVAQWGDKDGQFEEPYSVAMGPGGEIYVVDSGNHNVQKFDAAGTFVLKWGSHGESDGQFRMPAAVCVDPKGNVYVTDSANARIQKFDASGHFLMKWGNQGNGDGQLNMPTGIAVGPSGRIYVVDSGNARIMEFSEEGAFLTKWGTEGSGDGHFISPYGISIDSVGSIYVADVGNNRIQLFSNRQFVAKWLEGDLGRFKQPYGVTVAADGTLYVADSAYEQIQIIYP